MPILGIIASAISQALSRLFFTSSSGSVITTQDQGVTYTTSLTSAQRLNSFSYDTVSKTFLVGGNSNVLFSSTNGTTWTTIDAGFGASNINQVFAENSRYIAAVNGALTKSSTDLTTWTTITVSPNFPNAMGSSVSAINVNGANTAIGLSNGYILNSNSSVNQHFQFSLIGTTTPSWTARTSNFGSTNINAVAYGHGVWIAGGYRGQRSSTDGITWTTIDTNMTNLSISGIAYGNGLFVLVGQSANIRSSTNGTTWVTRSTNFGNTLYAVDYGNGVWVAGGLSGGLTTSTNGTTWTARTSNFGTTFIYAVKYGNGVWAIGGGSGQLRTSTDAITWTTATSNFGATGIQAIHYANGRWVMGAYGGIRTSTDLVTWTTRTSNLSSNQTVINYGNSIWVALSFDRSSISTDTITWTSTSNHGTNPTCLRFENDLWVVTGNLGNIRTAFSVSPLFGSIQSIKKMGTSRFGVIANNTYYDTSDFITYNQPSLPLLGSLSSINDNIVVGNQSNIYTYNQSNNTYVATDTGINGLKTNPANNNNEIIFGSDAITPRTLTTRTPNITDWMLSMAYGNGLWVGVSFGGRIRTSTDTVTWTTRTSNFGTTDIYSITYGKSVWVAAGNTGQIRTSTDGVSWTTQTSNFGATNINQVLYANNLFVANGRVSSAARSSTDGISWTTITGLDSSGLGTYGNGLYVYPYYTNGIRRSTDLVTWNNSTPNIGTDVKIVAYANGIYVASGLSGELRTSTDAITWTTRTSHLAGTVTTIANLNNAWVATGGPGTFSLSVDNGITWSTLHTGIQVFSVAAANNLWVWSLQTNSLRTSSTSPFYGIYRSPNNVLWSTTAISFPLDFTQVTDIDIV